ncbi:hypothetical protein LIER_41210 [Lithospermum erythrorhizon]|uniref:Uncharacterized protein n=1 Tax=Lithospermum erythrorhizon TaxID=34254 RepID=A0AAV3R5Y2_LITER
MKDLDLCFPVHVLSQFLQAPKKDHWAVALRVVRYLKGCLGQGVLLRRDCDLMLSGWSVPTGHLVLRHNDRLRAGLCTLVFRLFNGNLRNRTLFLFHLLKRSIKV